jgi:hypothetical protein
MNRRTWDARCSEILRRMAGDCHDQEIAASIEAETGKRFRPRTVAEYRRAGDLPPCRRNDWTAPLKIWRAGATNVTIQPRREELETAKGSARLGEPSIDPGSTAHDRPDEIEITSEMIDAGAEVLRNDPSVGDLLLMDCESIARAVIRRALEVRARRTRSSAHASLGHL